MGLHDGHRKRLKAQFLSHGEDFHDHQLLELLLCYAIPQGDVNELSHALLERFGSLAGVMDALPESLRQVPGVVEHVLPPDSDACSVPWRGAVVWHGR